MKRGQIRPFWPWKRTFRAIQVNPPFWQFISTLPGKLYAKIEKKLLNSFGANGLQVQKEAKFDLTDLEKWPLERFNQIYLSICDLCHPKEAPCQKKKKSYWSVSEIDPSPPQSWRTDGQTDRRTDGQTDGQTDRRTTDKSVLEKLRCLSAGGAKNDLSLQNENVPNFHMIKNTLFSLNSQKQHNWIKSYYFGRYYYQHTVIIHLRFVFTIMVYVYPDLFTLMIHTMRP